MIILMFHTRATTDFIRNYYYSKTYTNPNNFDL